MNGPEENTPLINQDRQFSLSNPFTRPEDTPRREGWQRLRKLAHENVEGTIDSPLEYIILALIFANVVLLALSTLVVDTKCFGSKCTRIGEKYDAWFEVAEAVSVVIFTFEYILRIWACMEFPNIAQKGPIWGRLAYALTFFPLVDLLSIAPYWIAIVLGGESPDFTTAIRVFRLVRLLKADKYLNAFGYVLLCYITAQLSASILC